MRLVTTTYPDGEVVTNSYTTWGPLNSGSSSLGDTYLYSMLYNDMKLPTQAKYGNTGQLTTDYTYWANNYRLKQLKVSTSSSTLLDLTYSYDNVGNVSSIADVIDGSTQTSNFAYDELDRLTSATGAYSQSWEYDEIMRMLVFTRTTTPYSYSYTDSAHKHAVTSVSYNDGTPKTDTYQYDANGNTTYRNENGVEVLYTYNMWNQLTQVISGTTSPVTTTFTYDGDGRRVKKAVNDGVSTSTTYYAGKEYEKEGGTVTKHYFVNGKRIAQRAEGSLSFVFGDHLQSASLLTDATGTVQETVRYYAYGEMRLRTGNDLTNYLYTSQELDSSSALYYYGARYYNPRLGRFLTADVVAPELANPLSRDKYAYVLGNPLKYVDPTGECGQDSTEEENARCNAATNEIRDKFGFTVRGEWLAYELEWVLEALNDFANKMGLDNFKNRLTRGDSALRYIDRERDGGENESGGQFKFDEIESGAGVLVFYDRAFKQTGLRENLAHLDDKGSFKMTFAHETGHAFAELSSTMKNPVGEFLGRTDGTEIRDPIFGFGFYWPGGTPPSNLARGAAREDLAESVAYFMYHPIYVDEPRSAFVRDLLGIPSEP